MKATLKVLFLAAEADPFVKVGGLGDVAGSLPGALRRLLASSGEDGETVEIDVRLAIPFHGAIQRKAQDLPALRDLHHEAVYTISNVGGPVRVEAFRTEANGVPVYLIGGPFIPPDEPVYTPDTAVDGLKFTYFSLAALELARVLGWQPDLIHANDWHAAPAVYALGLNRQDGSFYEHTATLLEVHNLPYLGSMAGSALAAFGLPPARGSLLPYWAQDMPLPLGLLTADHIVTVSPTYAQEILTEPFGSGLHEFLQSRRESISGILNGIDLDRWDPRTDTQIGAQYDERCLENRQANKAALQAEFGLPVEADTPLLAIVSRMDPQKGVDLLPEALGEIGDLNWQMIILGTGVPEMEAAARQVETDFPNRARASIRFDLPLSRRIYSSADALLIPSRYEPGGLTQMIAMRYGCVPVARSTGGLHDTIIDNPITLELNNGFLFQDPTPQALAGALARMLQVYAQPGIWQGYQQRGMAQDFSWERSARQYLELYEKLVRARQILNKEG